MALDLLRYPWIARLVRSRWPLFLIRAVTLAGFLFTILAGLLGTPVGGFNFAIIFVWIAWWTLLKLALIPLGGRVWCSVCPIPLVGDWLQQGGILPGRRGLGLNRRWPRKLRGSWLHLIGFAFMGLFSAVLLTRPAATAAILALLFVGAVGLSLIFERRAFCRYLCPMGAYMGWYAQLAPVAVRVRDPQRCRTCVEKPCFNGGAESRGCPWMLFPAALQENFDCGMCMNCVRACPYDNMTVRARPFGQGERATHRVDRAWFGLFLLMSAPVYSAVMLGPWGALKGAAYALGAPPWFLYAFIFLVGTLGVGPGLLWLAARAGWLLDGRQGAMKQAFTGASYALAPLGLGAWTAFTFAFAFGSLAYVWPVLSDPLGWGWNLFGTANWAWQPYLAATTPFLQVAALLGGLGETILRLRRTASRRAVLPVLGFAWGFTVLMLWLLV